MKSLPSVKLPRSHHSSLWVWLILLVILLSGVMYLGFKINQRNALIAATKINSQKTNVYSHDAAADSKHVLQILRAQGLVGQSIYKTKIFLPDANLNSTSVLFPIALNSTLPLETGRLSLMFPFSSENTSSIW